MKRTLLLPAVLLSSSLLFACGTDTEGETQENQSASETSQSSETNSTSENTNEQTEQEFTYQINSQSWGVQPIEDTEANEEVVLLTIDDAPDTYSLEIAETLYEMDAPAIFFVNGMYIEDEEGQEQLRQIHDMGFEIGNHTHTHANLQTIPQEQQYEEIMETSDLIEDVIGERPRFFRAPHGANTEYSESVVAEDDMTLMNWSYGYDWQPEYQDPNALADIMVNTELLGNGANLLMHDREWTMQAMPEIVTGLRENGYEIVDPANIISNGEESEETN